jgi:hypothetical protein
MVALRRLSLPCPTMPAKKKPNRNLSGLKNQGPKPPMEPVTDQSPPDIETNLDAATAGLPATRTKLESTTAHDSMQINWELEDQTEHLSDLDSELDSEEDYDFHSLEGW